MVIEIARRSSHAVQALDQLPVDVVSVSISKLRWKSAVNWSVENGVKKCPFDVHFAEFVAEKDCESDEKQKGLLVRAWREEDFIGEKLVFAVDQQASLELFDFAG